MRDNRIYAWDFNDEQSEKLTEAILQECEVLDWKECSDHVLEIFDKLLKPLKMEVVTFDMGDDTYYFTIGKIKEKTKAEKLFDKMIKGK